MTTESGARVVLDTHVLLDLWVFADAAARPLLDALRGGVWTRLRCVDTDAEFVAMMARPRFGLSAVDRHGRLAEWHRLSVPVPQVRAAPWTCRDPHDQKFLDLAYSSAAGLLLTRDRALLALAPKARSTGLRICRPQDAQRGRPVAPNAADGRHARPAA